MASIKTGAIVVSWGSVIPGRERQMLEVLQSVLEFNRKLQDAGRIKETRLFVATTGSSRDTLMVFGTLDELARLLVDDEFESHMQDGMMVMRDLNVALWAGGTPESLGDGLKLHAQKLAAHGLL